MSRNPRCSQCKTELTMTRPVVGGVWLCGDCVYLLEYGPARQDAPRPPRAPKKRAALRTPRAPSGQPQEETLFPVEGFA